MTYISTITYNLIAFQLCLWYRDYCIVRALLYEIHFRFCNAIMTIITRDLPAWTHILVAKTFWAMLTLGLVP